MTTLTQQAAADAAKTSLSDEQVFAFQLADLMSSTPLDFATYQHQQRKESEKARKDEELKRAAKSGPQMYPPPAPVPRTFELEAISATYSPKSIRKIVIARPQPKRLITATSAGRSKSPTRTSPQLSPQSPSQQPPPVDSDIVILHGLYRLQAEVLPFLTSDEQHLRQVIEQHLSRLCPPYGLRSLLEMFMGSMFHNAGALPSTVGNGFGAGGPYSPLLAGGPRLSNAAVSLNATMNLNSTSSYANLNASLRGMPVGSPNASFAHHMTPLLSAGTNPYASSTGSVLLTIPTAHPNFQGSVITVETPTPATIGKGGHWDSATNLRSHIERMDGHVSKLRGSLKELFDCYGDEALFGPAIGFELNHAIVLWGHCKERLLGRLKMAEFRDRKEFLSDKMSRGSEGTGSAASPVVVAASAALARYDGVLGALDYICKNLLPSSQLSNPQVVPLTLHYAIARAGANAQSGANTNASMATNLNASFNFNPNASFRKAGSPSFSAGGGGFSATLIHSHDNAFRVTNLISALYTALEVFRWEFDIIDESVLTIEAIEAAIQIAVEWLRGATA